MMLVCNPGTHGADWPESQALENLQELIGKLLFGVYANRRREYDDGQGRYAWELSYKGRTCLVLVPGCPPEALRWAKDQFPVRYYVNGNSWQLEYALIAVATELQTPI